MVQPVREVFEMTGFLKLMVHEEQFVLIRDEHDPEGITLIFNGEMQTDDNVRAVEGELSDIRKKSLFWETPATVIFDLKNLVDITPYVCKLLKQSIHHTASEKRIIRARGALPGIQTLMEYEGLADIFD